MTTLAIIPARGGSTGIPRKNIKKLAGKPLVAYSIGHAQESEEIDDCIVTSDDREIRETAESYGAKTIGRPDAFAHDATWQEVDRLLVWTVGEYEKTYDSVDIVVLLYPTAPLRDVPSINKAVRLVKEGTYDSVLSVYYDTRYLWKAENNVMIPTNYEPCNRMPRQKEHWNQWAENKAIYVMKKNVLLATGCRLRGTIGSVEMEKWRSVDIDTPQDFILAEALIQKK